MNGIVFIIALLFFFPGLVYAFVAGTAKNGRDISRMMGDSMANMGTYIVIVFFAAQMLAFFNWSNLGIIIAIKGAALLEGQNGITLILGIVALSAGINMLIGSASAKWAILAPIFVPMMMLLGYHPAFTQMIYRVGDSSPTRSVTAKTSAWAPSSPPSCPTPSPLPSSGPCCSSAGT